MILGVGGADAAASSEVGVGGNVVAIVDEVEVSVLSGTVVVSEVVAAVVVTCSSTDGAGVGSGVSGIGGTITSSTDGDGVGPGFATVGPGVG